jgi:hypothetical protein
MAKEEQEKRKAKQKKCLSFLRGNNFTNYLITICESKKKRKEKK